MFKPIVEYKLQQPLKPTDGQSLTEAALLEAQKLSINDVAEAEAHLGQEDVRPVLLKSILNTYESWRLHFSMETIMSFASSG